MHYITGAEYLDGFRLRLTFDDGVVKRVDLEPYLEGSVFEPLKDLAYFKRMTLNRDIDTVVWPNDADFSPDFLYDIGEPINESVSP